MNNVIDEMKKIFAGMLERYNKYIVNKVGALNMHEQNIKNCFINSFIEALGFDLHELDEVQCEYCADIYGNSKKEDYAIFHNSLDKGPSIILEAKSVGFDVVKAQKQLEGYFIALRKTYSDNPIIALLSDGITYLFYSDIERSNYLDDKPFYEFSILNMSELDYALLGLLHKSNSVTDFLTMASKYKKDKDVLVNLSCFSDSVLSAIDGEYLHNIYSLYSNVEVESAYLMNGYVSISEIATNGLVHKTFESILLGTIDLGATSWRDCVVKVVNYLQSKFENTYIVSKVNFLYLNKGDIVCSNESYLQEINGVWFRNNINVSDVLRYLKSLQTLCDDEIMLKFSNKV